MSPEAVFTSETSRQKVMAFIEDMTVIKIDGQRRRHGDLDTFVLLTFDQKTGKDEIEFVSWAEDQSRIDPNYIKILVNFLKLPKSKDHPYYPPKGMEYYEDIVPEEGKKVPAIALGTGSSGRTFLFRLRGMSTKNSFQRLKSVLSST